MDTNTEYEKYEKAKKQVQEIKGFYSHLTFFVLVMALLIFINLSYSPQYLWFLWTLVSWGIMVIFHALWIFNWFPVYNKDWEKKKIEQFMREEKNKANKY